MRCCVISDTHDLHRELSIPPSKLLICAGDFSFFGRSLKAMDDFNVWLGEQPAEYRVITCGNHEYPVEAEPEKWRKRLSNATLLLNEGIEVEGTRIWGSPTTKLYGGAFGIGSEADREKLFNTIPSGTDILISHSPPLDVLDCGQGCAALRRAVIRVKPRLHCFGHIHGGYGTQSTKHTMFVNAALLDEDGAPSRKPIQLDLRI